MQQVRHSFLPVMISDSLEWVVWGRCGVSIPGGLSRTGSAKMGKDISIGWTRWTGRGLSGLFSWDSG